MKVVKNIKEIFKKTNKIREEGIILSNFFFTKKRILELIKKKNYLK